MNRFDPRYMQLLTSKLESIVKKEKTVVTVAQEMGLSRQTIHKHLLRYKRFGEDGIRRIQTRRYAKVAHNRSPEENGKIERFHATLNQKALKYGFNPNQSLDEIQYRLSLFMYYYNYQKNTGA